MNTTYATQETITTITTTTINTRTDFSEWLESAMFQILSVNYDIKGFLETLDRALVEFNSIINWFEIACDPDTDEDELVFSVDCPTEYSHVVSHVIERIGRRFYLDANVIDCYSSNGWQSNFVLATFN